MLARPLDLVRQYFAPHKTSNDGRGLLPYREWRPYVTRGHTMNADQVTRRQARAIKSKVEPFRYYLYQLRSRMSARGFAPGDPLFDLVRQAETAIGELFVDIEYRTKCGPVELPPKPFNSSVRRSSRMPKGER